jgi:hypothetical protein
MVLILPCCTFLSNKDFVHRHYGYHGVKRVVIFLQRWPVYQQLPGQDDLGAGFIKKETRFLGPWLPAAKINPRAVDIKDIDDQLIGELLLEVLQKKGYEPFLAEFMPAAEGARTAAEMMAKYQAVNRELDAFLFCFYSPTLFVARPQDAPPEQGQRSYGLEEVMQILGSTSRGVVWAGPRAALVQQKAISHAFVYLSLGLFRALDWQPLWEVADSQVGGKIRPVVQECLPAPTDLDYWADARIIKRLMRENLRCRLRHIIPEAF